jgi:hypothetical protein
MFADPPESAIEVGGGQATVAQEEGRGHLTLGPGYDGTVVVNDSTGRQVATVQLRPEQRAQLDLPAGGYEVLEPDGSAVSVSLDASARSMRRGPIDPPPAPAAEIAIAEKSVSETSSAPPSPEVRGRRRLDPLGASLASFFVPGLGQTLNGRPATGVGIFLGTLGLVGASALAAAPPDDPTRRDLANEGARLGGFALSTAALQLLWAGQWMHAYRDAKGGGVSPRTNHRFALEVTRNATLAPGADRGSVEYLRDWSLSLLGQPYERVQLGLSDVAIQGDERRGAATFQAGFRVGYRVYQRRALWMNIGGGAIGQLDVRSNPLFGVAGAGSQPARSISGSASVYAQYDFRIFIIDRWSLNIMPRFYLPVGTRRYADGGAVSSLSPSLELGTGVGVVF